jgi:hypothetical protein
MRMTPVRGNSGVAAVGDKRMKYRPGASEAEESGGCLTS